MSEQETESDGTVRAELARVAAEKQKLSLAIQKVRHQARLISDAVHAGHPVTAEQQERLERLRAAAKVIRDHQAALQAALETDAAAVEAQRRAVLRGEVPRDPGHVRMEELRALQQTALTADDEAARFRAAQAVKPVLVSGGATGFRVAPDLVAMDFSYLHKDKHAGRAWTGNNREG